MLSAESKLAVAERKKARTKQINAQKGCGISTVVMAAEAQQMLQSSVQRALVASLTQSATHRL